MSTVSLPEFHRRLSCSATMQRLVAESHARNVITKREQDAILSGANAIARAEMLLTALENAAEDPRSTGVVLDILGKSGDFAFIAERIKNKSTLQPTKAAQPTPGQQTTRSIIVIHMCHYCSHG